MFGTGLSRTMSNDLSSLVSKINQSKLDVYSVDIPSGINGDTSAVLGEAFKTSKTITPIKKCHYCILEKILWRNSRWGLELKKRIR